MAAGILAMFSDVPTVLIAIVLLVLMLAANEAGFRLGSRHRSESDLSRSVSNTLKGSIFTLVALLLGFSFSATTSRHDLRQKIVLDQANAIGTCYQRAGLLDDRSRDRIRPILRQYVKVRLEHDRAGRDATEHARTRAEIERLLSELWAAVEDANRRELQLVRNSQIVPAANEVIDLSSTRSWANRNHIPPPVLVLLLVSVVVSALLLGHSSGQTGARHVGLWVASNFVLVLVLYVVLDFDRPRSGLIQVDRTPLIELDASLGGAPTP